MKQNILRAKIILPILLVLLSTMGAASTLSVSEINYTSNSSFYNEDHLQIQFLVDGTGETVSTTIPPNKLNSLTNAQTEQSIEINADIKNAQAEYAIQDRNLPKLYNIQYVREEFNSRKESISWAEANCIDPDNDGKANYEYYSKFQIIGWGHYVNCGKIDQSQPVFNVGFIQSPPDTSVRVNWTVKADGKPSESAVISNSGLESGSAERIGEHSQIEFIGLRDLGSQAPNPQNTLAAYSSQTGWKLISKEDYFEYKQYIASQVPKKVEEMPDMGTFELSSWKNTEHRVLDKKYSEAQSYYGESSISGSNPPNASYSRMKNGVWIYEPENNFRWFTSEFLIRIDGGEYLEIEKTVGKPKIQSVVSDASVNDISDDNAEILVMNEGNGKALFEGRAICEEGVSNVGTSVLKSLKPGETKTFRPLISASSNESFNSSCRFIVEDRESLDQDSTTFDVHFSKLRECRPGSSFIQNKNSTEIIFECAENGVDWIRSEVCSEDEHAVAEDNGYTCEKIEKPNIKQEKLDECEISLSRELGLSQVIGDYTIKDPYCTLKGEISFVKNSLYYLLTLTIAMFMLVFIGLKAAKTTKSYL